jgi:hypothetical protein
MYGEGGVMEEEEAVRKRVYYGELKWNGSTAYPDGAKYTGEILDGAPHGRGALVTRYGLYVGEFVRGKRQGKGQFTTESGDELAGDWGDFGRFFPGTGTNWGGVLNGMGVAKYRANARVALRALATGAMTPAQVGSAGGTYEGDWKDGEWHGKGAFSAANGDVYLGEFFRGKFHGRGLLQYHDGGFYKGGWYLGKKDGNGTLYYANGDLYEGGWLNDLRSGWGTLWYWDGTLFEGYWRMGLKQGWGRETIERTGEVYVGQFLANLRSGHGVIHYGNGDAYHGGLVDGMRHGDGVMHYADSLFKDVGYSIKAGFMFDEPRVPSRMTQVRHTYINTTYIHTYPHACIHTYIQTCGCNNSHYTAHKRRRYIYHLLHSYLLLTALIFTTLLRSFYLVFITLQVDATTAITRPTDGDTNPDDNLQYWGAINTNYQIGDGYKGTGR